jgi:hypothetical protein
MRAAEAMLGSDWAALSASRRFPCSARIPARLKVPQAPGSGVTYVESMRCRAMGDTTEISWTDATFNPWIGCQHVSPGCDHCYAKAQNAFRKWDGGWRLGPTC